ncbi:hypothetical protein [Kocuria carniphila]|uniref:hypothetical protein n=1 Tax=Kocuria carniphila TaxID=262208 RepID=UPI0034CF2412
MVDSWEVLGNQSSVVAAGLALVAIWQASLLHTKSKQPYVVVSAVPNASRPEFIEISIKNYGPTAATNVRLKSDVKPMRPQHNGERGPQELELYGRNWTLAPGEEWRTGWGHLKQVRQANEKRRTYCGKAYYIGQGRPWYRLFRRPRLKTEFFLDLTAFDDRTHLDEKTVHSIGKNVEEILERLGGPTTRVTTHFKGTPMTLEQCKKWLGWE